MKRIMVAMAVVLAVNCNEAPKEQTAEADMASGNAAAAKTDTIDTETSKNEYPKNLSKVFEAHGGLDIWRKKRNLSFVIPKPDAAETHNIDLYDRRDKIVMPTASMGYDGENVWLMNEGKTYEGNAAVYHNLMFYFYAMPFVLADDGINYADTEALEFEGKSYPGIHISYDDGVGASPKDDYYLYYDADTHKMAWLGYTFTFGSDKRSDDVSYIRYADWAEVDGVLLPKTLTWYINEGTIIKDAKNPLYFENISLSETVKPAGFYDMPEKAAAVE
ncbi:MAG: DUF6503 family protein [Pricia sp.]